jgi:DNA-directed RNA polymerase sigma subunit (sigma70/sigma32)
MRRRTPIVDEEDSQLGDFIENKNAVLPLDSKRRVGNLPTAWLV